MESLSTRSHHPELKHPFPCARPTINVFLQLREVEKSHKSVKDRATARNSEDTAKDSSKNATKAGEFHVMITFYKATWKGVKSICCEVRSGIEIRIRVIINCMKLGQ